MTQQTYNRLATYGYRGAWIGVAMMVVGVILA